LWGVEFCPIPLTNPVAVNTALTSSATAEGLREHAMPMTSCHLLLNTVLFCYLAVLDPRVGHTMDVLLHLSLTSVILIDSSTGSPVHVLIIIIIINRFV